jgi:hypothetical protein
MRLDRKSLTALIVALALSGLTVTADESLCRVLDRVVAYVDDRAITLTEFQDTYAATREKSPDVSPEEIIESMINRLLLIKEARKIRLEAASDDDLLNELIEIKIRAPIVIREDGAKAFYESHRSEFGERDFLSVRDDIEQYLFELEATRRLKEYLEQLRGGSEIRIQLR